MEDAYLILEKMYKTTCLVYERCSSGRHVHAYNNHKQTAWAALKLFKLRNDSSTEQIARKAIIDLVKWVGEKVSEANAGRQSN